MWKLTGEHMNPQMENYIESFFDLVSVGLTPPPDRPVYQGPVFKCVYVEVLTDRGRQLFLLCWGSVQGAELYMTYLCGFGLYGSSERPNNRRVFFSPVMSRHNLTHFFWDTIRRKWKWNENLLWTSLTLFHSNNPHAQRADLTITLSENTHCDQCIILTFTLLTFNWFFFLNLKN